MRTFICAVGLWVVGAGCGAATAGQVQPTVAIEDGQLILYDELASEQVPLEILFALDSDVIGDGSHRPLEVLAGFINNHQELPLIEVQGHTDEQGTRAYNMALSRRRARAVVSFLIEAGVDPARLRAEGFGDTRPISRAGTPETRAQSRRVQFVIVTEVPTNDET